jgi:FMN phosphatase YigB (HAD superfamily)
LYLKDVCELSPNITNILQLVHSFSIPVAIITYNKRVHTLLEKLGLEHLFDCVLVVDGRETTKSSVLTSCPLFMDIHDKKTILFFDNDPLNIYDVSSLGVTSFLVNPAHGITYRFVERIIHMTFNSMYEEFEREARRLCTYVERSVYVQNMCELRRLLSVM